jgi:DNA-binding transcriptional LysR family regulator
LVEHVISSLLSTLFSVFNRTNFGKRDFTKQSIRAINRKNSEINEAIHSKMTNISLEQLHAFVAVSEYGGVNAAAEKLFKSPSTISHALSKLQASLGLALFEQQGRKLHLTEQGSTLLKQARVLLNEKQTFINIAQHLQQDHRGEIALAVDAICPHDLLLDALQEFAAQFPLCQIKLHEGVLSGAEEQLLNGRADICVAYRVPQGFLGERLINISFVPVVHACHPLAHESSISSRTLMAQRQVVISDSGSQDKVDSGWLKATQRWSVSSMHTAIEIINSGMAFGWIPRHLIDRELTSGELIQLQLKSGGEKSTSLFITLADESCAMSQALAGMLVSRITATPSQAG